MKAPYLDDGERIIEKKSRLLAPIQRQYNYNGHN